MKLEKYISDLLYRYDLVIVPEFGGIIARRKPAHYNEETYVFSPPYKELSFNVHLQKNDALLATYLADLEGTSYDEAVNKIASCVREWKNILQKQKRLKLDQIGVFNLIQDDRIVFMPLTTRNYLPEAYGLSSYIHRPSIKKEATVKHIKPQTAQKTAVKSPVVLKNKKNKKKVYQPATSHPVWKYAAVVLLGLGLFGGGIYFKHHKQTSVPIHQKATFVLPTDFPAIQLGNQSKTKEIFTETTEHKSSEKKYFIISGAFRSKNNAERKLKELTAEGYDAQIIGKNKRGLWMVAYNGFADRTDAEKQLIKIKNFQKSAWIFTTD